jgi:hypothetical protein
MSDQDPSKQARLEEEMGSGCGEEREDKTPFGESSSRLFRARGLNGRLACTSAVWRFSVQDRQRQEVGQGGARALCRAGRQAGKVCLCMWVLGDVVVGCCAIPTIFWSFFCVPKGAPNVPP